MAANISTVDITEKVWAEQALNESKERYQAFFDSHNLIFITDADGNFIEANQAAMDIAGYQDQSDILGRNIADDFYQNPEDREIFIKN